VFYDKNDPDKMVFWGILMFEIFRGNAILAQAIKIVLICG
jgi:hypothetical protein